MLAIFVCKIYNEVRRLPTLIPQSQEALDSCLSLELVDRMELSKRTSGMFGFTIVWLGQIISVLASMMTQFALTIWAFEKTGSATALGLVQVFFVTPFLLISPLAGALVDAGDASLPAAAINTAPASCASSAQRPRCHCWS